MIYDTLISAGQLQQALASATPPVVLDCSFDLTDGEAGQRAHDAAHIPGAFYVHLDRTLSGAKTGRNGRHPLPGQEDFVQAMAALGLDNVTQVVAYDNAGGMYAARLWWMLRWAGHDAVAVLDGGLQAWQAAGQALSSGEEPGHFQSNFELGQALETLKTVAQVEADLGQATQTLIDARAPARYRGEVEPLDPVAGHIPGALNRPFGSNIAADGRFKPAALLKAEFDQLLAGRDPASVVHQCGSGVSATPNVLAMRIAGFAPTALFAGSWSEWCSDPGRPVERG